VRVKVAMDLAQRIPASGGGWAGATAGAAATAGASGSAAGPEIAAARRVG
jgi:hypothetical protein